jgi:hypothetical protein
MRFGVDAGGDASACAPPACLAGHRHVYVAAGTVQDDRVLRPFGGALRERVDLPRRGRDTLTGGPCRRARGAAMITLP